MKPQTGAADLDTTMAQRQVGASAEAIANFSAPRVNFGTSDASFSWGTHALRPAAGAGLAGDRYYETDRNWIYYHSGTAWLYLTGINYGTNAARAAITVSVNDNGAWFYATDTKLLWQVVAGAWAQRDITAAVSTASETLLNSPTLNLNTNTKQTLYTVPSGKSAVITRLVFRGASVDITVGATVTLSFGFDAGALNWTPANAFRLNASGIVDSTFFAEFSQEQAGGTAGGVVAPSKIGIAAQVFGAITDAAFGSAATVVIDVYGYLF